MKDLGEFRERLLAAAGPDVTALMKRLWHPATQA
jgi:hypothetical protein